MILKSQPKFPLFNPRLFLDAAPVAVAPMMHINHPALVGVTSTVLEEYNLAWPNDYEEYKREQKKKAMEAEVRLERDVGDPTQSRLNISGEEAATVPAASKSSSPPSNVVGFVIRKSEKGGLELGAGEQMTAVLRTMAKMGWKQGQRIRKQEQGITTPLMAKKMDRRAEVIVNASETKPEKRAKGVCLNGPPTRGVAAQKYGSHLNPAGKEHSSSEDEIHHAGEVGNITLLNGFATFRIVSKQDCGKPGRYFWRLGV